MNKKTIIASLGLLALVAGIGVGSATTLPPSATAVSETEQAEFDRAFDLLQCEKIAFSFTIDFSKMTIEGGDSSSGMLPPDGQMPVGIGSYAVSGEAVSFDFATKMNGVSIGSSISKCLMKTPDGFREAYLGLDNEVVYLSTVYELGTGLTFNRFSLLGKRHLKEEGEGVYLVDKDVANGIISDYISLIAMNMGFYFEETRIYLENGRFTRIEALSKTEMSPGTGIMASFPVTISFDYEKDPEVVSPVAGNDDVELEAAFNAIGEGNKIVTFSFPTSGYESKIYVGERSIYLSSTKENSGFHPTFVTEAEGDGAYKLVLDEETGQYLIEECWDSIEHYAPFAVSSVLFEKGEDGRYAANGRGAFPNSAIAQSLFQSLIDPAERIDNAFPIADGAYFASDVAFSLDAAGRIGTMEFAFEGGSESSCLVTIEYPETIVFPDDLEEGSILPSYVKKIRDLFYGFEMKLSIEGSELPAYRIYYSGAAIYLESDAGEKQYIGSKYGSDWGDDVYVAVYSEEKGRWVMDNPYRYNFLSMMDAIPFCDLRVKSQSELLNDFGSHSSFDGTAWTINGHDDIFKLEDSIVDYLVNLGYDYDGVIRYVETEGGFDLTSENAQGETIKLEFAPYAGMPDGIDEGNLDILGFDSWNALFESSTEPYRIYIEDLSGESEPMSVYGDGSNLYVAYEEEGRADFLYVKDESVSYPGNQYYYAYGLDADGSFEGLMPGAITTGPISPFMRSSEAGDIDIVSDVTATIGYGRFSSNIDVVRSSIDTFGTVSMNMDEAGRFTTISIWNDEEEPAVENVRMTFTYGVEFPVDIEEASSNAASPLTSFLENGEKDLHKGFAFTFAGHEGNAYLGNNTAYIETESGRSFLYQGFFDTAMDPQTSAKVYEVDAEGHLVELDLSGTSFDPSNWGLGCYVNPIAGIHDLSMLDRYHVFLRGSFFHSILATAAIEGWIDADYAAAYFEGCVATIDGEGTLLSYEMTYGFLYGMERMYFDIVLTTDDSFTSPYPDEMEFATGFDELAYMLAEPHEATLAIDGMSYQMYVEPDLMQLIGEDGTVYTAVYDSYEGLICTIETAEGTTVCPNDGLWDDPGLFAFDPSTGLNRDYFEYDPAKRTYSHDGNPQFLAGDTLSALSALGLAYVDRGSFYNASERVGFDIDDSFSYLECQLSSGQTLTLSDVRLV